MAPQKIIVLDSSTLGKKLFFESNISSVFICECERRVTFFYNSEIKNEKSDIIQKTNKKKLLIDINK